uniref:Abnormal spindle-like microcephaly-associated protein ASH domain-containing protein n=1 Tax=Oncorhynchus mykiss TaxID=8022 RepID=A0A8C7RTT8_ONCMY
QMVNTYISFILYLYLPETYTKLKSNSAIQAEPSALHFSGFKLGKDYQRSLKLINISSEVINIHIIPTQTKHFKTKYLKQVFVYYYLIIPGLSYTVKVHFCPDEWRYFYDCIRVHCKVGIQLLPFLGHVNHVIPLSCSCPIDFEFQVYIIQPHKAFSVQPLSGVIPANGKVEVTVTFRPFQYDTSQVTLQVVISQFNPKPYVCTLKNGCTPSLTVDEFYSPVL